MSVLDDLTPQATMCIVAVNFLSGVPELFQFFLYSFL